MSRTVEFHTSEQIANWLYSTPLTVRLANSLGVSTKEVVAGVTGEVTLGLEEVLIAALSFAVKRGFHGVTS